MRLLHLTAVGSDVPPATLEFAPRLTVVYGASEVGKSYVLEALDFMLGGVELRKIPEAAAYRQMLLGIEFDPDDVVTLARDLDGGKVLVFNEDVRTSPSRRPPDRVLSPRHQKRSADSVSHYLLERIGIADALLRKNNRNDLVAMSFRYIAHLVLVGEEQMHSRTSPVETGNYPTRTTERSALKLLLTRDDDSELTAGEDPAAFRQVNRAQLEILDEAIAQVHTHLNGVASPSECEEQLARTDRSIQAASASVSAAVAERDTVVIQRDQLQAEQARQNERASDATALFNRFSLLAEQYDSDLSRLEMVRRAGTLLGYFDGDQCAFCGAPAEDRAPEHAIYESVRLARSIDAESARVHEMRHDLLKTLAAVQAAGSRAQERYAELGDDIEASATRLNELEANIRPTQDDLDQLISERSRLERWLGLWQQVARLDELRASVAQKQPSTAEPVSNGVPPAVERDFSIAVRRILGEWAVPDGNQAEFRFGDNPDVWLQQRRRSDRGKGMRSIIHAAFTVALAEYCLERELPHPNFIALDTPVLTYRDAERGPLDVYARDREDDEFMTDEVAASFYNHLANLHPGQTLVLENQTPPHIESSDCTVIFFSGNSSRGRAGFYPAS